MANFEDGSYSCKPGIDLLAKVLAGTCKMKYTKAKVGNGTLNADQNPKDQAEVMGYVMDAKIAAITNPVGGECQVTIQINSADVETGFYATGILLYAEGDDGTDVPYTYLVLENEPEWIRPKTSDIGKLATFDLIVAVGEVDQVTAVIDTDSVMTKQATDKLLDDVVGSQETYSGEGTYEVGDTCIHEGQMFRCKETIAKAEEWTEDHWERVDLYAETGKLQAESKQYRKDINQLFDTQERLYRGVDLSEKFASEIEAAEGETPEQKRWNWIKGRIDKADWSGLHVGDFLKLKVSAKKDETANSGEEKEEEHEMQIAGIDSYYNCGGAEHHKPAEGSEDYSTTGLTPIPHHIDFISRDLINTPVVWNTTAINCGTTKDGNKSGSNAGTENAYGDGTDAPYIVSNVRKYLIEKILPTIDTTVAGLFTGKAALLEVRGKQEADALTDSTWFHWYNAGKLWLPTEYEVYGSIVFGTKGWGSGQAVQYPLFANSGASRIKHIGPGGTDRGTWWLACAMGGSSTNACGVSNYGHAGYYSAACTGVRVPVCFRIAASPAA